MGKFWTLNKNDGIYYSERDFLRTDETGLMHPGLIPCPYRYSLSYPIHDEEEMDVLAQEAFLFDKKYNCIDHDYPEIDHWHYSVLPFVSKKGLYLTFLNNIIHMIDDKMMPIINIINHIPALCTMSSCSGHGNKEGHLVYFVDPRYRYWHLSSTQWIKERFGYKSEAFLEEIYPDRWIFSFDNIDKCYNFAIQLMQK
jgi:hypothetical protein